MKCKSVNCQADIRWLSVRDKKARQIVDAKPLKVFVPVGIENGETVYELVSAFQSHFATCPDANKFRKVRSGGVNGNR
mgnify:FL=1